MEYKNDKCEFTAFVKAGLDSKEQENIEICIERVTKNCKKRTSLMQGPDYIRTR